MKRVAILLSLVMLFTVSCVKNELETQQVPDVISTPCKQGILKSSGFSDNVVVEFTNEGVHITHYNFEVPCDFTTVNVTHTFVNGVLNITQQGFPNQANCICHTDVSYTITGISKNEINVIFINGEQVYCYNENGNNQEKKSLVGKWSVTPSYNSIVEITENNFNFIMANETWSYQWISDNSIEIVRNDHITTRNEVIFYTRDSVTIKDFWLSTTAVYPPINQDVVLTRIKDNQPVDWTNKTEELRIHNASKISIKEGIWGTLVKTEGDCMPAIDWENTTCKQFPVKREILIYEYTKINETRHEFTKFLEVYTKLVATATCDEEGFFELALESGKYSVFVREGGYLYANSFDGQGGISSITVESSKVSEEFLNLNYASY